jgi:L-fucose isomerase-like protein
MVEDYEAMSVSMPSFVEKDRTITTRILEDAGLEIVMDEIAFNVDSAKSIASKAKEIEHDVLVVNVIGWAGGDAALIVARDFGNVPILLWTEPSLRMSLCGYFEFTSDFVHVGRSFKSVLGKAEDGTRSVRSFLSAVNVAKKLHRVRIGQIGYPPPGFVDATAEEIDLRVKLGVDVVRLDVSEIFSEIEQVTRTEVDRVLSEFTQRQTVRQEELVKSIRTAKALENVFMKHGLSAAALRCLPELQKYSFPCLGLSRLSERGFPVACEGDLASAITLLILQELALQPAAVFDCDSIDSQKNTMRFWHCGHLATSLAESPERVNIQPPTYFGQRSGIGAVVCFSIKPGRVTLAKLDRKGEKMLILSGEAIRPDKSEGAYAEVRLDVDVTNLASCMAKEGMEHHLCLVRSDVTRELTDLCQILGIKHVESER